MKQRVVIIGNSFTTRLGIIRSVAEIGCEVTVIAIAYCKRTNPTKPIDCYSKYVNQVIYFDRKYGREGLVQLLLEKCTDYDRKPIIIPTSDFSAVAIDNDIIKEHFLTPYIDNAISSIEYWMNKANQKAIALHEGLKVASSSIIEWRENKFIIPDTINYPCFTKPLSSIGGGKKCQRKCDSRSDLQEVLETAEKNGIREILVEDFLKIDKEYAVLGFSDGNVVIIPGIIEFIIECQSHKGIAMVGKVIPTDGFKELIEKFSCFIRCIGFVGLFDIDFFKCQGEYYFGELNVRIGGSGTAIYEMGVNLPGMLVKSILGREINDDKQIINTSATFVNERMCMDDWLTGKLSTNNMHRIINSADIHFVKNDSDNAPYEELIKVILRNSVNYKRIIKRTLHIIK